MAEPAASRHRDAERIGQSGAVVRLKIPPAGVFCDTGDLGPFITRQAKSNDMGGEINTGGLKFRSQRAGSASQVSIQVLKC